VSELATVSVPTPSSVPNMLRELRAVALTARAIDFGAWVGSPLEPLLSKLVPEVSGLLSRALATTAPIALLGDHTQNVDTSSPGPVLGARLHAANIAFVARIELVEKQRVLARINDGADAWEVLSRCDRGAHKVWKIAVALEAALAELIGTPTQLHQPFDLELSLEVRRVYATFRRGVLRDEEPTARTIEARLVGAGASVARLVGRDISSSMRISDRAALERLRGRLMAWFHCPTGRCPVAGLRLWRDLAGFAVLLRQVNERAELVAHDLEQGKALLEEVASVDPQAPAPPELQARLACLRGACDELDRALRDEATPCATIAECLVALLRARCAGAAGPEPARAQSAPVASPQQPTRRSKA
jgi:hypothetical protein